MPTKAKINAKHFYRFTYLKSDHWQDLRLRKLVSVNAVCQRCGHRDLANDIHHLRYKKLYDVELTDLVVLCRDCHDVVHEAMDLMHEAINDGADTLEAQWAAFRACWGKNAKHTPEIRALAKEIRTQRLTREQRAERRELRRHFRKDRAEFRSALQQTHKLLRIKEQEDKRKNKKPKSDREMSRSAAMKVPEVRWLFAELRKAGFWKDVA